MAHWALEAATDVLAVHRITRLVVEDEITSDLRGRWFERHDPATTKLGYLVSCPWCAGFYVSIAAVAARRIAPRAWGPAARALALSSAVGIMSGRGL
jgi:hypothetical protein